MSEDHVTVTVTTGSDALMATAEIVARNGAMGTIRSLRESFLSAVDVLEKAMGLSPRTAELRSQWRSYCRQPNDEHQGA